MPPDLREPVALTIAGSDSSGGAGIQADLKTFTAMGVYGATVITALTAQNTRGVQAIAPVATEFVTTQFDSVVTDLRVCAAKTGMLATAPIAAAVARRLAAMPDLPLVVDPVMIASSGDVLLSPDAIDVYRTQLVPRATLLTPNLAEAARLLSEPEARDVDDCIQQARALAALGCHAVLLKGGHAASNDIVDVFFADGEITLFRHPRINTSNTHGTGCTLSAAITALLAIGTPLPAAVKSAIDYLTGALAAGAQSTFGSGHGPVDHLYQLRPSRN